MRKLVAVVSMGCMLVLAVSPVAQAQPTCTQGEPHTCAVDNQPFDLPVSRCGFPVHVGVVSDKEFVIHDTVLADGTEVQRVTGQLVLSFTNSGTGKTIVRNVSGPQTTITAPDGTGSFEGQGNSWLSFGPRGQKNTGEPGLVFTSGRVVVQFSGPVATSFSLDGTQQDGCVLLT